MKVNNGSRFADTQAGSRQHLLQAVVAMLLAASSYVWAINFLPSRETIQRQFSVPEEMLVKALIEVSENRIGSALEQIESLLSVSPNFRLAQLVKGDLLLARSQPIDTLGAGASSKNMATDLRAEARARLTRYAIQPQADLAPKYVVELPASQKYALVLDSSKSTLFVFENRADGLRYVADYYMSVGKNGTDKLREGDKRTPLGVYHITSKLTPEKLTDFYGVGAFPINYPNEWDRLRGRDGYGIWVHGTPFDTYSRPPRASDGCVVLANEDMAELDQYVNPGSTPVIIADSIEWSRPEDIHKTRQELTSQLEQWRRDWESRETEAYLTHYSERFSANGTSLKQWSTRKQRVNAAKTWIKVGISDLSIVLYPGDTSLAVVSFQQKYASNNLDNIMLKRQYWINEDNRWKILYEGTA
ncbi:MAG TPA: L,D-transpeptidase family protein [Burkholderiales bacterium]|nr:L,D-transpeptidase family protein [Burkholderiales bacterium]